MPQYTWKIRLALLCCLNLALSFISFIYAQCPNQQSTLVCQNCPTPIKPIFLREKRKIIKTLAVNNIQFTEYGDILTLIVPTDKYYVTHSAKLKDPCDPILFNIIKLIKSYPPSNILVAGFTDDVGSFYHKKLLSTARAETMLTYLWNYNIPAKCLTAFGNADLYPLGDNKLSHGSAFNRRIEIQWFKSKLTQINAKALSNSK